MRRFVLILLLVLPACEQRQAEQLKREALAAGRLPPLYTLTRDQPLLEQPPPTVTAADLERGQQRYHIYCLPCHGELGRGDGPVVQRGFPAPPSYHIARLRAAPLSHFYRVISDGYGVMYGYLEQLEPADRWRLALYIRTLQQSGNTDLQQPPQFSSTLDEPGVEP